MSNTPSRRFGLSKSRLTAFEQCPRRLWLQVHRRELGLIDEGAKARFAAGHEVGGIACALHPEGVMVEADPDLAAAVSTTSELISGGHPGPIFEATFQHDGVLVRVDLLHRKPGGTWRIAEVKSSTGPKDYHLVDLATQLWVIQASGHEVSSAVIRHIDNGFVLAEEGDYSGLFCDADLLDMARPVAEGRAAVVTEARRVLAGEEPVCAMGDHCSKPFTCEFSAHCASRVAPGPQWPVTILPNGTGRKWALQGIEDLLALEEGSLSPRDARILAATRSGEPFHDPKGARQRMCEWSFPLAYLDFETINPAVPRWIGTRPYQQVPFQFSLHLEDEGGAMTHREFLCADGQDPRLPCAQALIASIPSEATIVAYNAPFERRVLRELARDCPVYAELLLDMEAKTVDLLPVARECWYHRDQRGSWSIKAVLPTMSDLDYEALEVKDGGNAQEAFLEAISPATSPERRWALEQALKAYCERDTWAMVLVARALAGE